MVGPSHSLSGGGVGGCLGGELGGELVGVHLAHRGPDLGVVETEPGGDARQGLHARLPVPADELSDEAPALPDELGCLALLHSPEPFPDRHGPMVADSNECRQALFAQSDNLPASLTCCYKRHMDDETGDPVLGAGIRAARTARGLTQQQLADHIQASRSHISLVESGKRGLGGRRLSMLARVLGLPGEDAFWRIGRGEPIEGDAQNEPAPEHRGARVRELPLESFVYADGRSDGSLALDVIRRPTGKPGEVLRKQHAQRSDRRAKPQTIEIEGVPDRTELVVAVERVELKDEGKVINKGDLLIVDRAREPDDGMLAFGYRHVDARESEELPEVRLLRFHRVGEGWTLAAIDGTKRTFGTGDGWEVAAAVLFWRSP